MAIQIRVDTKAVAKALEQASSQIPYATSRAINTIAAGLREVENAGIADTFKNPRPFTRNSTVFDKASKQSQTATVRVKDAQAKYLAPFEYGGLHELPGQGLLVPIKAREDQYGQLPKGSAKKLFAAPGSFVRNIKGISGLWQRKPPTDAAKRKAAVRGVRTPRAPLKLLIEFGQNRPVEEHLDFVKRAEAYVHEKLPSAMTEAVETALRTMRK